LQLFYGSQFVDKLVRVDSQTDSVRLWGYVGHPSLSKSTRKGQHLFLNGRWIQDRSLQHALGEAYRGLLMVGRYPVAFLFFEMPPDSVDVNVHPTKIEVRFRDAQQLYRQLLSTLRTRFLGMDLDSSMRFAPTRSSETEVAVTPQRQRDLQMELAAWAKDQLRHWTPTETIADPAPDAAELPSSSSPGGESHLVDGNGSSDSVLQNSPAQAEGWPGQIPHEIESQHDLPTEELSRPFAPDLPHAPLTRGPHAPAFRVMQVHDCYLVVETEEGLTVIDQHALHERVIYEQLRRRVLEGRVESQRMLVPQTVELDPGEASLLHEHRDLLAELGLSIEEFGGNTVLLAGYPPMLARADFEQLIHDVAEQLAEGGKKPSRRDILDRILHMMSCKAAVKAGQRLSPEEIESLLQQRHLINDAHHCPHGRPTALVLSRADLDRQFGRLG
jgi:DNA mismatch repair protein MutL